MSRLFWILSVLFLGLLVRVLFLFEGGIVIDSDEAIVGLMAKHIAEGRQWPIFYYGQPYMGSLEPTLAAVVFRILGVGVWELKAVPLIFSLFFIYLVYLLGEEVQGEMTARVASLLAALPPVALVEWSTKARGGFIELVVLGTLALLVALKIARKGGKGGFFALSLVLGLAWWVNNQAIFYIVPIALYLMVKFPVAHLLKRVPAGVLGFFLGGAPFWYANLVHEPKFATFNFLSGRSSFPDETLQYLSGVFTESLPILVGAKRFWTAAESFPYASLIGYSLLTLSILTVLLGRRIPSLLILTFLTIPVIFSFSSFGWLTSAPRYLLPIYSVLFVLTGVACQRLPRSLAVVNLVGCLSLAILSNYQGGVIVPGQPFVSGEDRAGQSHQELYRWLKTRNYRHIRTNYWIGYRVAFETNELVTFSLYGEPSSARIPEYEDQGLSYGEDAPFIIVPSQRLTLLAQLDRLNLSPVVTQVGEYLAVETLGSYQSDRQVVELPLSFTDASSRIEWLSRVSDGDLGTRWGSGEPQRPGMYLKGELEGEMELSGLEISSGFWYSDRARGLSVELVRHDGGSSCLLFDGLQSSSVLRLKFPHVRGVGLKFYQTGSHPLFDWSIANITAYRERSEDGL